jgi:hypothetical protein
VTFWNNPCQGTVFERRVAQMHSDFELKPGADMENIYQRKQEVIETPDVRGDVAAVVLGRRVLKTLKQIFEQQADLNRLSARLREDAGIDEHKLEISTIARAPLIR